MENSKKKRNLCAIATFNPVQFNVIYIASRRFIRNVIYYFKLMQYLHEMYNWLLFYEAKSHIHCFPSFIMCGQHWFISIHHKRSVPVTQIRSDPDVHKIAFRISLLSQKKKKNSLKKKTKQPNPQEFVTFTLFPEQHWIKSWLMCLCLRWRVYTCYKNPERTGRIWQLLCFCINLQ